MNITEFVVVTPEEEKQAIIELEQEVMSVAANGFANELGEEYEQEIPEPVGLVN